VLSGPPGEYARKGEFGRGQNWLKCALPSPNLRELAGGHTRGGTCGSIGLNTENLTRADGRMKVRLKTLPDEPRGSAWPSSARTVRRAVKSVNERDPRPMLPFPSPEGRHSWGTARDKWEEGGGDGRSVYELSFWLSRRKLRKPWATRASQCALQWDATPKGGANPLKARPVQIGGCNSPS
jgi:hypothetical protein